MVPHRDKILRSNYGSAEEAGLLLSNSADEDDYVSRGNRGKEVDTRGSFLGLKGKAVLFFVAIATIVFAVAKSTSSLAQMKGLSKLAIPVDSDNPKKFKSWIPMLKSLAHVAPYMISTKKKLAIGAVNPNYLTAIMDSPWDIILEPYREMDIILSAKSIAAAGIKNVVKVEYTIDGYTFAAARDGSGNYIGKFTTIHYGRAFDDCVCKVVDAEGREVSSVFSAAAKYVRREIRTLTKEDKARFFDALKVVYDHKNENKYRDKYGSRFKSIKYFQAKHLNGAGTTDCDHWHDGAGMLNKHVAISLEMEQSLQSVDPSIALPYWEYSYDSEVLGGNWQDGDILSEDYFGGEGAPDDPTRAIPNSYFAHLEVPDGSDFLEWDVAGTGTLNPMVNAYGQLRTPWNEKPDKFVGREAYTYGETRYDTFPGCSTTAKFYDTDTLGEMMNGLNGALHGPVHIMIGGAWSAEEEDVNELISDYKTTERILYFKILWRSGITRCPTRCSAGEECVCRIPDWIWNKYSVDEMLTIATILPDMEAKMRSHTMEEKKNLLEYLATTYSVGDMLTSSAPFDPTFWPLHGQVEKLVGLKRINVAMGVDDFNMTFAFTGHTIALEGVCDWTAVGSTENEVMPACDPDATCYGHNADDLMEFFGFDEKQTLTFNNQEFLDWTHPWNDHLPYVYDTFRFEYCDSSGYPIGVEGVDYITPEQRTKHARRAYEPTVRPHFKSDKDLQKEGIFGYKAQKAQKAAAQAKRKTM